MKKSKGVFLIEGVVTYRVYRLVKADNAEEAWAENYQQLSEEIADEIEFNIDHVTEK